MLARGEGNVSFESLALEIFRCVAVAVADNSRNLSYGVA
jgi:hypothetical protein